MLIDLTLAVDVNDPVIAKASDDPDSYMSRGHIGTHLDVYGEQTFPPVEYTSRRALLVDVTQLNGREIGVETLDGLDLRKGDFVLFVTGHLDAHSYGSKEYFTDQPEFGWDLVHHLAATGVGLVGLDFPGMRKGEEHGTADEIMGGAGCYVVENVANLPRLLTHVGGDPFTMQTGWTGFVGSTGLACRVVADTDTVRTAA